MTSLFKYLHDRTPLSGTLFGIELEVERDGGFGDEEYDGLEQFGRAVEDGSLRQGTEIVTSPLTLPQVQEFADWYDDWKETAGVELSERCSTHIHVNVQDMNPAQLRSFIWLSIACEEVLMLFASQQRKNNTYCVTVRDSVNLSSWWADILYRFENKNGLADAIRSAPKYAAIGGFRLRDYGTVEFRMFDGLSEGKRLKDYCAILESLRMTAMTTPVEKLLDDKIQKGVLSVLTPVILSYFPNNAESLVQLLELGIEMANDTTRKTMSLQEILDMHKKLFPEEAPAIIIRGQFARVILDGVNKGMSVQEILGKYQKGNFEQEYGRDSGIQKLFYELCDLNKESDSHVLNCVQIIQAVRKSWGM